MILLSVTRPVDRVESFILRIHRETQLLTRAVHADDRICTVMCTPQAHVRVSPCVDRDRDTRCCVSRVRAVVCANCDGVACARISTVLLNIRIVFAVRTSGERKNAVQCSPSRMCTSLYR